MVGQPEAVAFSKLGYPDSTQRLSYKIVYRWFNQEFEALGTKTYHGSCDIKVIVSRGYIETWELYGNELGCGRYSGGFRGR